MILGFGIIRLGLFLKIRFGYKFLVGSFLYFRLGYFSILGYFEKAGWITHLSWDTLKIEFSYFYVGYFGKKWLGDSFWLGYLQN